jgi:hypothetical protein
MRRRRGFGRGGPGLLGTMARTAVVAGTASAVAGRVSASQEAAAREHQAAAQRQLPARTVDELHAQLTKLGDLKQAGLLTDDEFAQQKARLLAT